MAILWQRNKNYVYTQHDIATQYRNTMSDDDILTAKHKLYISDDHECDDYNIAQR